MVEGVLPGTFHETVKEMYHNNNLPPSVTKENIQEEIMKMRRSYTTAQADNWEEQREERAEWERET